MFRRLKSCAKKRFTKPLPLQNAIQDELDPDVYDANIKIIRDALYRGDIFYKDGNIQCEEGHKFGLKLSKAIKTVLSGKYNKTKKYLFFFFTFFL